MISVVRTCISLCDSYINQVISKQEYEQENIMHWDYGSFMLPLHLHSHCYSYTYSYTDKDVCQYSRSIVFASISV